MPNVYIFLVFYVLGVALLLTGLALIYTPLAFIVGGLVSLIMAKVAVDGESGGPDS